MMVVCVYACVHVRALTSNVLLLYRSEGNAQLDDSCNKSRRRQMGRARKELLERTTGLWLAKAPGLAKVGSGHQDSRDFK
jgi:hypothetical protein